MSTIAQLKARLTLETEQYMQEANKVIRHTNDMADKIQSRLGRSFSKALFGGIVGTIGATGIDRLLGSVAESMSKLAGNGSPAANAIKGLEQGLVELGKSLPILPEVFKILQYVTDPATQKFRALNAEYKQIMSQYMTSRRLTPEQDVTLRFSASELASPNDEFQHLVKMAEMQEKINQSRAEYLQLEKRRIELGYDKDEEAFDLFMKRDAAFRLQMAAEEERFQNAKRQAQEEREWEIEQLHLQEMIERVEAKAAAERKLESQISESNINLEKATARLREEMITAAGANNVQGIGTAVGGVRVAGAIDYSSKGIATSLEKIREIEKEIAENTKNLKNLRPA